jgi:hypothetical protein
MALETLISWIAKDLRHGRGSALGVAALVSVVGLFTATAILMTMPLSAETIIQAHIANNRVYFAPPKHWQYAKVVNRHLFIRCRYITFSKVQEGKEPMTESVPKPRSLSCQNSQRPVALLRYDISLWALAKHKILEGATLLPAAGRHVDYDTRQK